MKKSVSVVIPNYNGEHLLRENLPLVYTALQNAGVDFEIIVPDDASTDHSVSFLLAHYPDIQVVQNQVNRGFATNTNTGIFKCTKDLVLILNSDIVLTPAYFLNLFRYFQDSKTFGVNGRIISLDTDTLQDSAKYPAYSFGSIKATVNYLISDELAPDFKVPTFFLSGANALVDRQKLFELGGYLELYSPFYFEDADMGLRAWRLGYACYYEHSAICRHPVAATINKHNTSQKVKVIAKRNKMYLHYIHLNGTELYAWFALLLLKVLGRTLVFDKKFLKSFRAFIHNLPQAKEGKRNFANLQKAHGVKLSVADIYKNIKLSILKYRITKY